MSSDYAYKKRLLDQAESELNLARLHREFLCEELCRMGWAPKSVDLLANFIHADREMRLARLHVETCKDAIS